MWRAVTLTFFASLLAQALVLAAAYRMGYAEGFREGRASAGPRELFRRAESRLLDR